jgi:hypothetical protein
LFSILSRHIILKHNDVQKELPKQLTEMSGAGNQMSDNLKQKSVRACPYLPLFWYRQTPLEK